jgi:hypothetical protein
MRRYLILVSIIFFTACAVTKTTETKTKTKVETLTVTETVKLDTTIFIPAEKASLFIPIEKLQLSSSKDFKFFTQKHGKATINVKVDSLGITTTANCDSISKQLQFYKNKVTAFTNSNSEVIAVEEIKKGFSFLQLMLYVTAFSIVSFVAGYLIKTFKII